MHAVHMLKADGDLFRLMLFLHARMVKREGRKAALYGTAAAAMVALTEYEPCEIVETLRQLADSIDNMKRTTEAA